MDIRRFVLWMALALGLPAQAVQLPPDFTASYHIEKYGTLIANMKLSLQTRDDSIIYRSHSQTRGLAALFSDDQIDEISQLRKPEEEELPHLTSYQYRREDKRKDNQQFSIDWTEDDIAIISGEYRNHSFDLQTDKPVWDRLSVQLALVCQASQQPQKDVYQFHVFDRDELQQYTFERLGEESITINGTSYTTLKLKRQHGKRTTYLWLDTENYYLPVRIEQHKNGDLHLTLSLDKIEL